MKTLTLLLGVGLTLGLYGCGQSRVTYKQEIVAERLIEPTSEEIPEETVLSVTSEPSTPVPPIRLGRGFSNISHSGTAIWQTWDSPVNSSPFPTSSLFEMEAEGLGYQFKDWGNLREHPHVRLTSEESYRCVPRNFQAPELEEDISSFQLRGDLPYPFMSYETDCVESGIESAVRLSVHSNAQGNRVLEWIGTDEAKRIRGRGLEQVEFKVSARVGYESSLSQAALEAYDDQFDFLMRTYRNRVAASGCSAERSFWLIVSLKDGAIQQASLRIITRLLPVGLMLANHPDGVARLDASNRYPIREFHGTAACREQSQAWLDCLNGDATCPADSKSAIERNFGALLSTPNHFYRTRRAANRMTEWRTQVDQLPRFSPDDQQEDLLNPLSVQDFVEVLDAVELRPAI